MYSFLHCSSLDIRLFTYVISCSLFAFLSPYSVFLFFFFFFVFGVLFNFLDYFSPIALRLLLLFAFLVAQSLSFHPIFTQNPLSTNLNYNNSLPLSKYKKYLALRVLLFAFLVAQSLSFHPIFTQNPLSTNLNYNNSLPLSKYKKYLALRVLLLSELIRYCKIQIITIQLQPHQYDFPLKTRVANYLLTRLHIL